MNRLNQLPTLRIDLTQELSLNYRGKTHRGFAGDTVAAGLGVISADSQMRGHYDECFMKTEVTVIGGGAAGMAGALAAAESGQRVALLEASPYLGGCFDYRVSTAGDGTPLYARAHALAEEVTQTPNIA